MVTVVDLWFLDWGLFSWLASCSSLLVIVAEHGGGASGTQAARE